MHSAFVTINRVPTRVTTWGKWVEESFDSSDSQDLVICIPGNPGFTQFYNVFLQTLHEQLRWPVWIVGHAGHELPENENLYNIPSLKDNEGLYNLEGQVKHKVEFFEKLVPSNVRIHLIGHSVGAYIITELLKHPGIAQQVVKSYLMFPTIENIADTPNGKVYTNLIHHIVPLILFLAWFFSSLPFIIQTFLIYIYTIVTGTDPLQNTNICKFVNPKILKKVFFMASDEMVTLKGRNNDSIKRNLHKIKVYFGATDGWGPISYYQKLKDDIPEIEAEVCKRQLSHAFVLRSSAPTAVMVANWMRQN